MFTMTCQPQGSAFPCCKLRRTAFHAALALSCCLAAGEATAQAPGNADFVMQTDLTHLHVQIGGDTGCPAGHGWNTSAGGCAPSNGSPAPETPTPPLPAEPAPGFSFLSYTCNIASVPGYKITGSDPATILPLNNPALIAVQTARSLADPRPISISLVEAMRTTACTQSLQLADTNPCISNIFTRNVKLHADATPVSSQVAKSGLFWNVTASMALNDSSLAPVSGWTLTGSKAVCTSGPPPEPEPPPPVTPPGGPLPGVPPVGFTFNFRADLICGSGDSGYDFSPSVPGSSCLTSTVREAIIASYREYGYGRCPETAGYEYWLLDAAKVAAEGGGALQCSLGLGHVLHNIGISIQRENGAWDCQPAADLLWPPAGSVRATMIAGTGKGCVVSGYR